jgi:hypothetical protein
LSIEHDRDLPNEELKTKQFQFLSLLIKKGQIPLGEDMYQLGQTLGFDERLVNDIVDYYHRYKVIEFPILGPYIRLVYDWYKVLNARDRTLLTEGFLLKLHELVKQNTNQQVSAQDVFNALGYRAFSDSLVPAIVESLSSDGFIRKINGNIAMTNKGIRKSNEIRERDKQLHRRTLEKLGWV